MKYSFENKIVYLDIRIAYDEAIWGIDTENVEITNIVINGVNGILIDDDERICLSWGDTANLTFIELTGIGFSEEEMIALAESIEYVGA